VPPRIWISWNGKSRVAFKILGCGLLRLFIVYYIHQTLRALLIESSINECNRGLPGRNPDSILQKSKSSIRIIRLFSESISIIERFCPPLVELRSLFIKPQVTRQSDFAHFITIATARVNHPRTMKNNISSFVISN
jgi:hypothetical protein